MKIRLSKGKHSSEDICEDIFLFLQPQGMVLDLGCGGGRHSVFMVGKGLQVVGVDISIEKLNMSRPVFERVQADARSLPFKASSFSSVLCSEVLEHLTNPELCIGEVHRVLRTEGVALFTCPCLDLPVKALIPIYRKLAGLDLRYVARQHLHVFSTQRLKQMLSNHFEITALNHRLFLSLIERRLRIGYSADGILSTISKKMPLLHYFAAAIWIKTSKTEEGLHHGGRLG